MIVKNEEKVILRCLKSVKIFIDYWVIIDTGSTDRTMELIREELSEIPGVLLESPFVNFAHNRTEYMQKVRGLTDYCIFMDADEVLINNGFSKSQLVKDCYKVGYLGATDYYFPAIFRTALEWRYEHVVHEYPVCDAPYESDYIETLKKNHLHDGGMRYEKFDRDIRLISEELKKAPDDARYTFYLANSYWCIGNYALALQWYDRRIKLNGWEQEVYISALRAGLCAIELKHTEASIEDYFMRAMSAVPLRHEAYYHIGVYYNREGYYALAYAYLMAAKQLKYPKQQLFFERDIYDHLLDIELAVSMYWIGLYKEAADINRNLLKRGIKKELITANLKYCEDKLKSSIFTLSKEPNDEPVGTSDTDIDNIGD